MLSGPPAPGGGDGKIRQDGACLGFLLCGDFKAVVPHGLFQLPLDAHRVVIGVHAHRQLQEPRPVIDFPQLGRDLFAQLATPVLPLPGPDRSEELQPVEAHK
jgi:hypothetical protein